MTEPLKSDRPWVLTIAGFDPSAGAGVLADSRTFADFGCAPLAVVTSITFQNQDRVIGCAHQDAATVRAQLLPLVRDRRLASLKTGMLPTSEVVLEVARSIREFNLGPLVVDPVIRSTSGYQLIDDKALTALRQNLLSEARVVTPNIAEAEALAGISIKDEASMHRAAELIRKAGAQAVLVKGGHLAVGSEAIDVLNDNGEITVFRSEWISGGGFHGTGCVLSAAIAAGLAQGSNLKSAVQQAKHFISAAIRTYRT